MCMIKVRPEIDEPAVVPARVVRHNSTRRNSIHGSHRSRRSHTSVRNSRNRSRSRSRDRETTTVIETIKMPPPPPASHSVDRTETTHTMIIQGGAAAAVPPSDSHWGSSGSPRASVISTRSNRDVDYYVDSSASHAGGRSPRASGIRYVDGGPRGSSQRITDGAASSRGELGYSGSQRGGGGERYGYNNFHGRRSGSVSYVNPRHSAVSQRSARETREKVVVVDQYGNERYY
ncbi:uncharacterized protein H6S33_005059 [Morchella sextelata]|uniref:uncharacterized protein n=1 Tax=Morchella sextelata TaxID=1174677 RepID=UPI001D046265|nr:uncharacterized protein H6S33_005059 [Morchella sextelata]KAH0605077.1 hypothetical protein H6S33_005059 [Morchella sextelata]